MNLWEEISSLGMVRFSGLDLVVILYQSLGHSDSFFGAT